MVYGRLLRVRTYCAQYNKRKITTNSSTIGKEKDHSLCHPQLHTAPQPTMVYSTAGTYRRIGASIPRIRKPRVFVIYNPLPIAV